MAIHPIAQCPKCSRHMVGCYDPNDKMKLKRWWCPHCLHEEVPIGREKLLTPTVKR